MALTDPLTQVANYGEVFTQFNMPTPFYTVGKSGVIWTITKE